MKNLIQNLSLILMGLFISFSMYGQKKVQTFTVSKVLHVSADKAWQIVGVDYGAIANSHPTIISSDYVNGSLEGGEGVERVCQFNKKGTQFLKEKMVNFDAANRTFVNQVYQAGRFPVDPAYTQAIYKIEEIAADRCRFSFSMQYRTKPAFMGSFTVGKFKKLIKDYMISVEHHAKTGENVTKENFKQIKKKYAVS